MKIWMRQQFRKIRLKRKNRDLCRSVRAQFKLRAEIERSARMKEKERDFRLMLRKARAEKNDLPPYLTKNSWEHELNYKLWITKGARFSAARRCEDMDAHGQWAIAILSSYLIIVGLIPYVPHQLFKGANPELLGFGTTALSIILLACSLLISSRQYPLQARAFHECSLKIGVLYDRLRQAKEIGDDDLKRAEISGVTREYESFMPNYPNHLPIDYHIAQTQKSGYFKLNWWDVGWIRARYYVRTRAMLDVMILLGLLFTSLVAWKWHNFDNDLAKKKLSEIRAIEMKVKKSPE